MRIYWVIVLIALAGCLDMDNDKPKTSTQLVEIDLLAVDPTSEVNEEILIRARTRPYNGCWSNLQIMLVEEDFRHISLVGFGTFEPGNVCPEVIVREDTLIKFRPARTGEYYFRANRAPSPILRDTLEVE